MSDSNLVDLQNLAQMYTEQNQEVAMTLGQNVFLMAAGVALIVLAL